MKSVLFMVAASVAIVSGQFFPTKQCPPGEHSVLYCPQMAEPECGNPRVHELPANVPKVCDIPQCFCNKPTVRDYNQNGKCVDINKCIDVEKEVNM